MKYKQFNVKLKEDPAISGEFTGYASVFGNKDSYGDVMEKGAFAATLAKWRSGGDSIPVLWGHNMSDPDYNIGHVVEAAEDDHGLKVRVALDLESPKGPTVHRLLKGRRVGQMSFAYDVVDGVADKQAGVFRIKKVNLYEVSVVPIGANQETEILDVKASNMKDVNAMTENNNYSPGSAMAQREALIAEVKAIESGQAGNAPLSELKAQIEAINASIERSDAAKSLLAQLNASGPAGTAERPAWEASGSPQLASDKPGYWSPTHNVKSWTTGNTKIGDGSLKALIDADDMPVHFLSEEILSQRPRASFLEAIPVRRIDQTHYAYMRAGSRINRAAPVAEGELKPVSNYAAERVDSRLRVIAHLSESSPKMWFDEVKSLQDWLAEEMAYGLQLAIEQQVLNGTGEGENIRGLNATSGIQTQPFAGDAATTLRMALARLQSFDYQPHTFVLNPLDWAAIETAKSTTGEFLLAAAGVPVDAVRRAVWGVQMSLSTAVPVGDAWLLSKDSAQVCIPTFHTPQLELAMPGDHFQRNLVMARYEGLFDLNVTMPQGIVKIDLAA